MRRALPAVLLLAAACEPKWPDIPLPPSTCRPAPGKGDSIVFVDGTTPGYDVSGMTDSERAKTAAKHPPTYRMGVLRADTGETTLSVSIADEPTVCVGRLGDLAILANPKDGLHARRISDGAVELTQDQLAQRAGLRAKPTGWVFEDATGELFIDADDGRTYALAQDLGGREVDRAPSSVHFGMVTTVGGPWGGAVNGRWGVRLADGAMLFTDVSGQRTRLARGDVQVGKGVFGHPLTFFPHYPSKSYEFPDPPSVIIAEPVEQTAKGRRHAIKRYSLDGNILWTWEEPGDRDPPINGSVASWHVVGDASRLVHLTKSGFIAIDARTGKELWRKATSVPAQRVLPLTQRLPWLMPVAAVLAGLLLGAGVWITQRKKKLRPRRQVPPPRSASPEPEAPRPVPPTPAPNRHECQYCHALFDPSQTQWKCPHCGAQQRGRDS